MCPRIIGQQVLVDSQYSWSYVIYHPYFLQICKPNLNILEHHALACFFNLFFSHCCWVFFCCCCSFVLHYLSGPGYSHCLTDIIYPIIESSLRVHGEWVSVPCLPTLQQNQNLRMLKSLIWNDLVSTYSLCTHILLCILIIWLLIISNIIQCKFHAINHAYIMKLW